MLAYACETTNSCMTHAFRSAEGKPMTQPRHEPEVIHALATQLAAQLGAWLSDFGLTDEEVAGIARAAERDALAYCLKH